MAETAYIPGVCNINHAEITSRRKVGYIGLAMFLIASGAIVLLDAPWVIRLVVFIPAFIAAIGFLQAQQKFCVGYAAAGMQHAADTEPDASKVLDQTSVAADKRRARVLNLQSTMLALAATLLVIIL